MANLERMNWVVIAHKELQEKIISYKNIIDQRAEEQKALLTTVKDYINLFHQQHEEMLTNFKTWSSEISVVQDNLQEDVSLKFSAFGASLKNIPKTEENKDLFTALFTSLKNVSNTKEDILMLHQRTFNDLNMTANTVRSCEKPLLKLFNDIESYLARDYEFLKNMYQILDIGEKFHPLQEHNIETICIQTSPENRMLEEMNVLNVEGKEQNCGQGIKRRLNECDPFQSKVPMLNKNALQQLNELRSGLKYVIEAVSGPPHNPEFIASVKVDNHKFIGRASSKKLAKHAAAQTALASLMGLRTIPEGTSESSNVMDSTWEHFGQLQAMESDDEDDMMISVGDIAAHNTLEKRIEANKNNPVNLLREINPSLKYELLEGVSSIPNQRFRMVVRISDKIFEGTGKNKKLAKASAARAVLSTIYNIRNFFPTGLPSDCGAEPNLFNFPQHIADKISKLLMVTFNNVMAGDVEHANWKVFAGIAMTTDEEMQDVQVVGFATGTKCVDKKQINMDDINDCHAEIISRRCVKDFFYRNLELYSIGEYDQSIFMRNKNDNFILKPNIKFHMYISTAPCGACRIFSPHEKWAGEANGHLNRSWGVLRTKIQSSEGTIPIKTGSAVQTSDAILPSLEHISMSCSDKIASWTVVGLQGALLSNFVEPIYLHSIILGGLFHPDHMQRALFGRFEGALRDLPPKYALHKPKMCCTTSLGMRDLGKSPNFSVNWTIGLGKAEVLNCTSGKQESGAMSRLSKQAFFQRFGNICDSNFETHSIQSYCTVKSSMKSYNAAKNSLINAFMAYKLGIWVRNSTSQ